MPPVRCTPRLPLKISSGSNWTRFYRAPGSCGTTGYPGFSASLSRSNSRARRMGFTEELQFVRDDENNRRILMEYGFTSLVRSLSATMRMGRIELFEVSEAKHQVTYKAIRNEAQMRELKDLIAKAPVCAV